MSRYRFQLSPQGAVPKNVELAVRMRKDTPAEEVVAGVACVSECAGFGVTIDSETATAGAFYALQNLTQDPITIRVEHLGELCEGDCIEWDVRDIMNTAALVPTFVVTPDECTAVDITIPHDEDLVEWEAAWFGVYAQINGQPFCENLIFTMQTSVVPCEEAPTFTQWQEDLGPVFGGGPFNSGSETDPYTGVLPNSAILAYYAPSGIGDVAYEETFCGTFLEGSIVSITGGDPLAYADFIVTNQADIPTGAPMIRLTADGSHDYSGITIEIQTALSTGQPWSGFWPGSNIFLSVS